MSAGGGGEPAVGRVTRLLPLAVGIAAVCLFASELMTMFDFTPPGGISLCAQEAGDRHSNAQMVIAAFAILGTLVAIYGPSRPAAFSVATMGVLALLIFLISDLRVVNAAGSLSEACAASQGFLFEAEAIPRGGFYLELAAALALAVTGIALATLTPSQLEQLRPGGRGRASRGGEADRHRERSHGAEGRKGAGGAKRALGRIPTRSRARQRG